MVCGGKGSGREGMELKSVPPSWERGIKNLSQIHSETTELINLTNTALQWEVKLSFKYVLQVLLQHD